MSATEEQIIEYENYLDKINQGQYTIAELDVWLGQQPNGAQIPIEYLSLLFTGSEDSDGQPQNPTNPS
jgi:hypothetical protein